jgi:hypothetical protein
MNLDKIEIKESGLPVSKAKELIIRLIDNQIQNYRLQRMSEWEAGEVDSLEEDHENIRVLVEKKEQILRAFEGEDLDDTLIDVDFSLNLNIQKQNLRAV